MTELELGPLRFGIVGAGRLGRVLAKALIAQELTVTSVSSASVDGRSAATHDLQVAAFADPAQVLQGSDVVLICVPDDAIAGVALALAPHVDESAPPRVVHTSGSVGLNVLAPLAAAGCVTLSLHPLQTITERSTPHDLRGAAAAITAAEPAVQTFGHALAHALGMLPFDLTDEVRPLYHAAASLAANFTVTLQAAVRELTGIAGIHESVAAHAFASLARTALERVERDGPADALTGPIVRGDVGTVIAHLAALDAAAPAVAALYRPLANATVNLALTSGRLEVDTAGELDMAIRERVQA